MANRFQSFLIFRALLIALTLGYQILSLVLPFPRFPFVPVLAILIGQSLLNLAYSIYLSFRPNPKPTNFILSQLSIDILLITLLIIMTGGILSNLKFAYLFFILLSALFLEKMAIYALTILSLGFYFFALHLSQSFYNDFNNGSWDWSVQIGQATAAQFVVCFLTALLASFMQSSYRSGRQALRIKERQIHNLREIRRIIVESLPSGLVTCDPDGQMNYINQIGRRLLGIGVDDLISGYNAWSLMELDPAGMIPNQPLTRTERTLSVAGTRRILGISYTHLNPETGEVGFLIVFQDLTKIKMMEASKSLNDRMTAIGKMAAGVAHEIRNPLAAISGSVQVLRELTPDDEVAQELAGIVEKETLRLNDIISQFMAYARPGLPPLFNPVELAGMVSNFFQLTRNDRRLKQMNVVLSVSEDDTLILGDEARLTQVFWNLATNSFYACEPGGTITIGCFSKESDVVFFIEDDGKGMTEDEVKEIFTPFQSFTRGGTGLGMSIVYDIIKLHHATIKVTSQPGKGTRVEIYFSSYKE